MKWGNHNSVRTYILSPHNLEMRPIFFWKIFSFLFPLSDTGCVNGAKMRLFPHIKTEGEKTGQTFFSSPFSCGKCLRWVHFLRGGSGRAGKIALRAISARETRVHLSWLWLKRGLQNFTLSLSFFRNEDASRLNRFRIRQRKATKMHYCRNRVAFSLKSLIDLLAHYF